MCVPRCSCLNVHLGMLLLGGSHGVLHEAVSLTDSTVRCRVGHCPCRFPGPRSAGTMSGRLTLCQVSRTVPDADVAW
ncbi:hypothetical protein B296_00049377 [Ensete ventricosum]|uniref:Secreted protein n=1 Tax=Ensete ventricosum TaxID=4639 RepID=A0A426XAQ6_ENSVE|nr:hypothetical protein B296_00049377 [Ensete ventricosum]